MFVFSSELSIIIVESQDGDLETGIRQKPFATERVSTIAYVWARNSNSTEDHRKDRLSHTSQETRCLLVTTSRFRAPKHTLFTVSGRELASSVLGLVFLGFDDQLTLPRRSDLYLLSEIRDMRHLV